MSPQVDVTITPRKKSVEKSLFQSDSLGCLPVSVHIKEVTPIEDSIDKESDDENENDCATILTSKLIMMKSYDTDSKSSQMNRSDEDDNQQGGARPIIWPGFDTSSVIESSRNAMQQYIKRSTRLANARTRLQNEKEVGDIKAMDNTEKNSLYLSKDDFATMSILGQFNLGFILALDTSGHLWILDQHACDEKYNFEKLCKETKVHEQKLIAPLPLELSPSEENCVLEHMEIFENNGFQFDYDSSKPPRHRLSLIAVPHSGSGGDGKKAVQFGPQDVGALCAILGSDGACSSNGYVAGSGTGSSGTGKSGNNAVRRHAGLGNNSVMLPKAVAMFASRACRSSIMVGEALTQRKMEQIVKNLQGLDHPWTCAHGRPTVRHVKDLMDLLLDDESF
jgi:DNA mismatch repair protein PMS2